jgi:hypothetical protein
MASKHLTLRMSSESLERLERESEREGHSRSELARELIEEGLRMRRHPGIVFRDGAVGRRPALANGPQVWVIARVFREQQGTFEAMVRATSELTQHPEYGIRDAALYYLEFRAEIDNWLDRIDREAERAQAEWLRNRERVSA